MIGWRLRTRLVVGAGAAVVLAGVAAALLFGWLTSQRFARFTREGERAVGLPLARAAARSLASGGSPAAVLERVAGRTGFTLAFVDDSGRVVTSPGSPVAGTTASPLGDDGVVFRREVGEGTHRRAMELVLRGGVPVASAGGRAGGRVYWMGPLPEAADGIEVERRSDFLTDVRRRAGLAAGIAALAALALVFFSTGRMLRPIEALTEATRRMARGDLAARVAPGGRDEVGELAGSFNAMAESLERQERLRRDLVGDVAHELRTPLTNLRAQLDALRDGLQPLDAAALASLDDEVERLSHLVRDLQDLALADSGGLRLDLERVDPAPLVEAACASASARAHAAGVALESGVAGLPPVRADAARAEQVLRALLDNALRHTPAGGRVRVEGRALDDRVELIVNDTGEGIGAEHLPFVFERFWRADPSRARETGGAGLGLAIARQLARAQGGDVVAESPPGSGARLTFTLPRELASRAAITPRSAAPPPAA